MSTDFYKKKVIERIDKDTKNDVFMYVKVALDYYYKQNIWSLDRDRYKVIAQLVTEAVHAMVVQGKVKHGIDISHAVVGLVCRNPRRQPGREVDPQARYQHTEKRINYPATDGIRTTAKQHHKGV